MIKKFHECWPIYSLIMVSVFPVIANADYYSSYPSYSYGGSRYSSYNQRSRGPLLSLELDQKKIRDSDFRVAARQERIDDMRNLLKQGADVNSKSETGETALMYASRQCATDTVQVLLRFHANEAIRDNQGRNALMYAVMTSCEPVVEVLLSHARNSSKLIDTLDESKKSVLDYSLEANETEVGGAAFNILTILQKLERKTVRHHLAQFRSSDLPKS